MSSVREGGWEGGEVKRERQSALERGRKGQGVREEGRRGKGERYTYTHTHISTRAHTYTHAQTEEERETEEGCDRHTKVAGRGIDRTSERRGLSRVSRGACAKTSLSGIGG